MKSPFPSHMMAGQMHGGGGSLDHLADKVIAALMEIHGKNLSPMVDFHLYRMLFSGVDNNAISTQTVQIESGSNFVWAAAAADVRESASGLPFLAYQGAMTGGSIIQSWPLRVKIIDAGDGHELQNAPYPLGATFGNVALFGAQPLQRARLWPANTTISVELSRFAEGQFTQAGAPTNFNIDVELCFIGYRILIGARQGMTAGI